jgi:phage repressor protein C with HTH and peptisase S24 domain
MNTLADRLTLAINAAGITKAELARRVGISAPSVNGWFTGKAKFLRGENLLAAARALDVDQDWLASGKGAMQRHVVSEAETAPYLQPAEISSNETQGEYVRVQQLDAEAGMGGELVNDDNPEVVRAMDFTPSYIRSVVGFLPPPGRLVLITGRGDSMIPVIQPGDVVMVDTGTTSYDGDGIYLINTGGGQQIKALQHRGDAIYVVSANAGLYPAFPLPKGAVVGGKVYLRNRIERFN